MQLVNAANDLRRRPDPEINNLGKMWYTRWLQDHPELQKNTYQGCREVKEVI